MAKISLDQTDIYKNHWETIQQWRIDTGKNFARSRGTAIARMAAGGQREGTQQWQDNLQKIESARQAETKGQQQSATMGILDKWAADMKDFYVRATKTTKTTVYKGRGEQITTRGPSSEMSQLKRSGNANLYTDSGLSESEFTDMDTEEFMQLQFGYTKDYSAYSDQQESTVIGPGKESLRRQSSLSATSQTSPWWA